VSRAVLIVDDDDAFGDLADRVVTSWGHVVVGHAGSVAAALEQAAALRPDTALVDIGLPDGDGFSLTERLIAMPWPMRVILISSDSDPANLSAARRAGALGFVPKDELSSLRLRNCIERADRG
jgi:DNA-binding NarL/FixJ family response regulator